MATDDAAPSATPAQARDALALADLEESRTVNRPVPGWYYPVLATLVLVTFLPNAVSSPQPWVRPTTAGLTLAAAVCVAVLVARVSWTQPGYLKVRAPRAPMVVGGLVGGALAVTPILLQDSVGPWVWAVCGGLLSLLIATLGTSYWRRHRHA